MPNLHLEPDQLQLKKQIESFGPHTLAMGILLVILGTIGIVLPGLLSIATVGFLAGLLILGGGIWVYHTYKSGTRSFMDWLKPQLLLFTGVLMLIFPVQGVASLALLLTFYFVLDSYSSFSFAYNRYPDKGWGWMVFNGLVDLLLASLFIYGWPASSPWLVGLFVGISLLFDGWALIAIGWAMRKSDGT